MTQSERLARDGPAALSRTAGSDKRSETGARFARRGVIHFSEKVDALS